MQDYFVHESSYVDDGVTIGAGTKVWHFCHIQKGAVIGRNCSLGQNVNVANNVRIGDGVRIQNNVSIYEGVEQRIHLRRRRTGGSRILRPVVRIHECEYPEGAFSGAWRVRAHARTRGSFPGSQLHRRLRPYGRPLGADRRRCRGDTGRERLCFDGRGTGQADRVGVRMRPSGRRLDGSYACACGRKYRLVGENLEKAE